MSTPKRPLSIPEPKVFAPLYVPSLMVKAAERGALCSLQSDSRETIYPLLNIVPVRKARHSINEITGVRKEHPAPTLTEHLDRQRDIINEVLAPNLMGGIEKAMIDVSHLDRQQQESTLEKLRALLNDGVKRDLVPVVSAGQLPTHAKAARMWNTQFETGLALRLRRAGERSASSSIWTSQGAALKALADAGGTPENADLILDLGSIASESIDSCVDHIVQNLPSLLEGRAWRTVTVLAGSFPQSIGKLEMDMLHMVPRSEYALWEQLRKQLIKRKLRIPIFGDYAMVYPEPPSGGTTPQPNLRYTNSANWLVLRRENDPAMATICRLIREDPSFRGRAFSRGDEWIEKVAGNLEGAGNGETWIRTGLQHHLAFVVDQLREFA